MTTYEMQVAIADLIQTAAPSAVVKPRNILRELDAGSFSMIEVGGVIHGWFVSYEGRRLTGNHDEYDIDFAVWQLYGYQTGNDSANSEQAFLDEADDVILAFTATPPAFNVRPPVFYEAGLFGGIGTNVRPVHINKGRCTVEGVKAGCT